MGLAIDSIAVRSLLPSGRDAQDRQLAAAGFTLLECLDLDGRVVQPGEQAAPHPELHYVARRLEVGTQAGAGA